MTKKQMRFDPDLMDEIVLAHLFQLKVDTLKDRNEVNRAIHNWRVTLEGTLAQFRPLSRFNYGDFINDIGKENGEVRKALAALRQSIWDNGFLFLDENLRFRDTRPRDWPNPSADA